MHFLSFLLLTHAPTQFRRFSMCLLSFLSVKKSWFQTYYLSVTAVLVSLRRLGYRQSFNHAAFSRNGLWFSCPHRRTAFMWRFICTFPCSGTLSTRTVSCCGIFHLCGIWFLPFNFYWNSTNPLIDLQLYCCGVHLLWLRKYHSMMIKLDTYFSQKELQNGNILRVASADMWGLGELHLYVCLCVCGQTVWLVEAAPRALWGKKDCGMAWWGISTPSTLRIIVFQSQVCGTLRK